jgi:hypothetical protein
MMRGLTWFELEAHGGAAVLVRCGDGSLCFVRRHETTQAVQFRNRVHVKACIERLRSSGRLTVPVSVVKVAFVARRDVVAVVSSDGV